MLSDQFLNLIRECSYWIERTVRIEKPHCKSAACNIFAKRKTLKRPMQSSESSIVRILTAELTGR